MSFDFEIKADPSQALAATKQVEDGLKRVQDSSGRLRDEIGRFVATGQTGAASTAQSVASVGDAATAASRNVEAMTEVLASAAEAVGLAFGAHEAADAADQYVGLQNRLRSITTDQGNLNAVMAATYDVAQETRTRWEDVGNVYNRVARSSADLGLSQKQMLGIVEELAQATKVNGATSSEAATAMNELIHGFSIGTLTGREFRTLAKDMPGLLTDLAQAAGVTRSQFVEMGMRGQVTAQQLVQYLGKAAPQIAAEFAKTMPTIGDSIETVHNAATKFFGEAAVGSGVMTTLTSAIQFVARNFDVFAKSTLAVVQVVGGLFVIEKVVALVRLLAVAVAANPLGVLVTALLIGVNLLRQFSDQLDAGVNGATKVSDVLRVLWGDVKELAAAVGEFISGAWHTLTDAFSNGLDSTGIKFSFQNVLLFIASFVDAAVGLLSFLRDNAAAAFGALAIGVGEAFFAVLHAVANLAGQVVNKVIDMVNSLRDSTYDIIAQIKGDKTIGELRAEAQQAANTKAVADLRDTAGARALATGDIGVQEARTTLMNVTQDDLDKLQEANTTNEYAQRGLDATGHRPGSYLSHVDTSFDDPAVLKRMGADVGQFIADGTKAAMSESTVKDYIAGVMQRAAAAAAAQNTPHGSVSDAAGTANAPPETKAEEEAARKLLNELRGVVEQSNQVTDAQEKLAHAQDLVNDAMKAGRGPIADMLAKYGGGAAIMDAYRLRLKDALDPFNALVVKTVQQTASLRDNADEQARATELEKDVQELKSKGLTVTENQVAFLTNLIDVQQRQHKLMAEEQQLYTQIVGPSEKYQLTVKALDDMLSKETITAEQYNRAIDQSRLAYLNASGEARTMAGGVEAAWLQIKDGATNVGQQIGKVFTDAFGQISDAIVSLVTTGTVNWKQMIDSMLADLTRLMVNQAFTYLIGLGGGATGGGLAGLATSVVAGGIDSHSVTAGYATGGSFTVGGTGGTDSQVVAFRATPNEKVSIQNPARSDLGDGQGGGGQGGDVHHHHMHLHLSENELLRGVRSRQGRDEVQDLAVRAVGPLVGLRSRR